MSLNDPSLKLTLAKAVAALQIGIGALLLVGTIGLTLTAYRTVRVESARFADNLTAAADALDSSCVSYKQSATNLFGLTGAMDDVAEKMDGVSRAVLATGEKFMNYGDAEQTSFWDKLRPFTEWFKNSGEKLKEVGKDVVAVSIALKMQSKAIKVYHENGYEKSLDAMQKISESLRHSAQALDNDHSAARWCGFVCVLGFCVSMLFFTNGALLLVLARSQGRA